MNRKELLKTLVLSPLLVSMIGDDYFIEDSKINFKKRINHSVCRWTFDEFSLEELCNIVQYLGFSAIDLVEPKDFNILKKYDINCSMCTGAHISLEEGFCNPKNHKVLIENYKAHINLVADAGYTNLICFSGNRQGMSEDEGLKYMAEGIKQLLPLAEKRGVVLQLELFNSIVDHPDYMADHSAWGIKLCQTLGSENFKLLYDIYHMQIMEGNMIQTIKNNHQYFGHYHTAGVPGRHEIDDTQELNYKAIMNAIADTGFTGYVAQEFIAKSKHKVNALAQAIQICDV